MTPSTGLGRRILLVDDSVDATDSLADLLRLLGHDVAVGHDGRTALALALQFRPEVAVLDLRLPGMSGLEVARQLRGSAELAHVVLIALTGSGSLEDHFQSRDAGFDHHFTKPLDLGVLNRLLSDMPPLQR